ncbi:hypothetical protein LguiB_036287 [Lonicera macranthoides]
MATKRIDVSHDVILHLPDNCIETNLLIISGIENERPIVCPKLVICALLKFPVIERRWSNEMNLCMKAMVRANWLNG